MVSRFEQLREQVISLEGWPRSSLALLLGSIAALALPPLHIWPILVPSFVGLCWLIEGSSLTKRSQPKTSKVVSMWLAFSSGWWFGLGYFVAGLYWVSLSFFVDAAKFAWLAPFAVFFLSAGMALYIGFAALATYVSTRQGPHRVLLFSFWWVIFEWIRGWAFSGFPWKLLGSVWTFSEPMIQITAITGVLGLSLITVLAASVPAVLGDKNIGRNKRLTIFLTPGIILVLIWIGGNIRLQYATNKNVNGIYLHLVQPNISQKDKWKGSLKKHHIDKLLRLSEKNKKAVTDRITHTIWPETATPLYLSSFRKAVKLVSAAAPIGGALITGAPRQATAPSGLRKIWNSIHVIDSFSVIRDTYDKHHLVPFGEYIPFRNIIGISNLTGGRIDFSRGVGSKTLNVPGAPPALPLICYEAIFSLQTIKNKKNHPRPGWLLNLTNDAWFGSSSGPYQHFAAAQLRSVEEGLPLIRVANTGLSGVIDSYGKVRIKTKLNEETSVTSGLPIALSEATWFSKHKNKTIFIILLFIFGALRTKYFAH